MLVARTRFCFLLVVFLQYLCTWTRQESRLAPCTASLMVAEALITSAAETGANSKQGYV